MRWRCVISVCVLILAGCGSGDDDGTGPPAVDAAESSGPTTAVPADAGFDESGGSAPAVAADVAGAALVAHGLVATFGDEPAALAAVLLAADDGYDVAQIIRAGATSALHTDGQVTAPDGSAVAPRYEPSRILIDDVTGGDVAPSGFRSTPKEYTLSGVLAQAGERRESVGLIAVLLFLGWGYSPEQIVEAIVFGAPISGEFEILDDDGDPLVPSRTPLYVSSRDDDDDFTYEYIAQEWDLAGEEASGDDAVADDSAGQAPDPTASEPAAAPTTDEADVRRAELVDRAVGVYVVTTDLTLGLLNIGEVSGVSDVFGEMVVEPDGTVSGSLTYTIHQSYEGTVVLVTATERSFPSAQLEVLDDGLTFETQTIFDVTWNGSDLATYGENVTGLLDIELGLIEVSELAITDTSNLSTVMFERR